jgi:hypothetical protein
VNQLTFASTAMCQCIVQPNRRGGHVMRKIIVVAGVTAIAAVAAVWSVSTLATPKLAGKTELTQSSAPISPHDIMVKQGKDVQIEYWPHPF